MPITSLEILRRDEESIPDLDTKLGYLGIEVSELPRILDILASKDRAAIENLVAEIEVRRLARYDSPELQWVGSLQQEWQKLKDADTPEAKFRRAIHHEIIMEELTVVRENIIAAEGIPGILEIQKSLTFIAGLPGAGKSAAFDRNLSAAFRGRHLPVDADDLRAKLWRKLQQRYAESGYSSVISQLPDYDESNYDHVIALQQEAADLAQKLVMAGLNAREAFPIFYMGTLRNAPKIMSFISRAQSKGIPVKAIHLFLSLTEALRGVLRRPRQVDLQSFINCTQTYQTLEELINMMAVDAVSLQEVTADEIKKINNYPITQRGAIIAELKRLLEEI